jgi:peptide/nickel transport system ATP-binding protein
MSALVEIRGLTVEYLTPSGPFVAVEKLDLDIGEDEIVGLAGESGSGKSTVALAVMRLLRPPGRIVAGRIRVDDEEVLDFDSHRLAAWRWRTVSMVFQSAMNALNPVATVFEQFRDVLARHLGLDRRQARRRAAELLALIGVPEDRLDDYPHQLSGGMRQRVVLAIALALEPRLVILDEPTTALDVVVQREILDQILELKARLGFSILFITHDLALLSEFADRIGVMFQGRLVEITATADMLAGPRHAYAQKLWQAMPRLDPAREAPREGT